MHHRPLPYLLLAASFAVAVPATAADPLKSAKGAAANKQKDRADTLFDQAGDARDAGRFADAERLLLEAWSLKQTHDVAANLGLVQLKLGKLAQGAQRLAWALQNFPPSESAKTRRALAQELATARSKIGALRIQPSVDGADVTVNGQPVDATTLADEVFVEPGTVTVTASRTGYVTATRTLSVIPGAETQQVPLALVPAPMPVGSGGARKPLIITGAVLAGAGVVMGVALTVVSNTKAGTAETTLDALVKSNGSSACSGTTVPASCSAIPDAIRGKNAFGTAAAWSFIGGGAVGAATLIYALAAPKTARTGSVVVAPTVGIGGGGLTIAGAW
jgi:hypothetical protein